MLPHMTLLAVTLPALTFAGLARDAGFRGDTSSLGLAKNGVSACSATIGHRYVALNSDQWNATQNCNQCIEVVCADDRCSSSSLDSPVILYVTGECKGCEDEGLDVSPETFQELTKSSIGLFAFEWEFIACPVNNKAYEAGKVEPGDEVKTEVSILQANEEEVEALKDSTETQPTSTSTGGTSLFIVVLGVAGAVCALALVAVIYKAKKNRTRRDECVTKSFDTFSSPAQKKKKAAIVTI